MRRLSLLVFGAVIVSYLPGSGGNPIINILLALLSLFGD